MGGLAIAAVLGGAGAGPSRLQRLNLNSNLLSAETQRALADALRDTSSECVVAVVSPAVWLCQQLLVGPHPLRNLTGFICGFFML